MSWGVGGGMLFTFICFLRNIKCFSLCYKKSVVVLLISITAMALWSHQSFLYAV